MNDRDRHICMKMIFAAIAVILFLLVYSLAPIPLFPLAA